MTDSPSFSLASLGSELDAARRSRTAQPIDDLAIDSESDSLSPLSSPVQATRSLSATRSTSDASEKPFPLCLLCLARPPTAVLLPCCHLNLCHLCAPLLLLRHRSASQPPSLSSSPSENVTSPTACSDGRTWNSILARATASHPKSRRLSMGGYAPPETGVSGGEMCGVDLLASQEESTTTGMTATLQQDGQVNLGCSDAGGAKCLMCRGSVKGWLRVYTG